MEFGEWCKGQGSYEGVKHPTYRDFPVRWCLEHDIAVHGEYGGPYRNPSDLQEWVDLTLSASLTKN